MYIFSRAVRLAPGDQRQQMHWAEAITEKVNHISEVPVLLWAPFASPQADTLAWSAAIPTLALLEATFDKLMVDQGYLDLLAEGSRFGTADGATDQLVSILHADRPPDSTPIRYATAGRGTALPGQMGEAVKVGIDICKRIRAVTDLPTTFGALATGPTSTFQWSSTAESIQQLEEGMTRLNSDPDFMRLVDQHASKVFAPGGEQTMVRRIL